MAFGRLRLDHPEWVLYLSSDVGFGGFDQIVQPAIRRIRQKPAFAWSYRHPEFRRLACNIRSLGDALVAGVAKRPPQRQATAWLASYGGKAMVELTAPWEAELPMMSTLSPNPVPPVRG